MKGLTVDSCVYLSAFLSLDAMHKISAKFLERVSASKIQVILPSLIPLEVTNTLYRRGAPNPEEIFQSFYETQKMKIAAIDKALGAGITQNIRHFNLKTADWIIAGTCLSFQTRLITWDHSLLEQTRASLKSLTPEEYLRNDP